MNRRAAFITMMANQNTQNPLLTSLSAYWKMDEASGNAVDATGRGNTLTNTTTVAYATGKINNAASFDGTAKRFQKTSSADVVATPGGWTVAAWLYLHDKTAARFAIWKASSEYMFYYDNSTDRYILATKNGGVAKFTSGINFGSPPTDTWHLMIFWYDPVAQTLNIQGNNGTVSSLPSITAPIDTGSNVFCIGASNVNASLWNGMIDEVGVWQRVLTAAERTSLYNGGLGLSYPFDDRWNIVYDGDSQTVRGSSTSYPSLVTVALGSHAGGVIATTGYTIFQMISRISSTVTPMFNSGKSRNILIAWGGLNNMYTSEMSAADMMTQMELYCDTVRAEASWTKIGVATLTPTTIDNVSATYEARRLEYNTALRAGYSGFADFLLDIGGDATVGDVANCSNATYYEDKLHLAQASRQIMANLAIAAIRSMS